MDSQDPEESWTPFEIDTISFFCKEVHRRAAELLPKPKPKQTRRTNQSRKPKRAPKPRSKAERSRQAAERRQARKLKSIPPTSVSTPESNTTPVIAADVSATPPVAAEAPARTGFPIKLFHRPLSRTELEWIKSHGEGEKDGVMDWEVCAVEFQKKFQHKVNGKILQKKWTEWEGECGAYAYSVFEALISESSKAENQTGPFYTKAEVDWLLVNCSLGMDTVEWREALADYNRKFGRNRSLRGIKVKWFALQKDSSK